MDYKVWWLDVKWKKPSENIQQAKYVYFLNLVVFIVNNVNHNLEFNIDLLTNRKCRELEKYLRIKISFLVIA